MSDRAELEADIKSRHERGDLAGAAEVALRGYGPEIYGFIHGFHRNEDDAADVFALFSERLWKGLAAFGWRCSFRTWAYTVARNVSRRHREQAGRRAREVPLPDGSFLSGIAEKVRTETAAHLKSQNEGRVARLREALSDEERMLLSLRLDRKLAWNELARVLHDRAEDDGAAEELDDELLRRESARLRKRFQAIKDKLAHIARREGLLGDPR